MRVRYCLDFTHGDEVNIRVCAVHCYEIDPIDIDSTYIHNAVVSGRKNGEIVTFWKLTCEGDVRKHGWIKIGERKVKGYIDLLGVKKTDMSKL